MAKHIWKKLPSINENEFIINLTDQLEQDNLIFESNSEQFIEKETLQEYIEKTFKSLSEEREKRLIVLLLEDSTEGNRSRSSSRSSRSSSSRSRSGQQSRLSRRSR